MTPDPTATEIVEELKKRWPSPDYIDWQIFPPNRDIPHFAVLCKKASGTEWSFGPTAPTLLMLLAAIRSLPEPAATESTTAKLAALAVRMQEEMDWFMQAVESALNTISANVGEVTRSNDYLARRTSANVLSADFAALRTEHPELFAKEDGDDN